MTRLFRLSVGSVCCLLMLGSLVAFPDGSVATDAEAAQLFGGCGYYDSTTCGTTCGGEVHTLSCQNNCCTGTSGWKDEGPSYGTATCQASCGGSNCGTIVTGVSPCG
jgi:hypothetical protein